MKVLALAAAAFASAAAPNLRTVILQPTQLGKGYDVYARKDGFGVKAAPTLDLCGKPKSYPSESLRIDRLQVDYLKKQTRIGLSNEVVRYKPGGAVQAMRELRRHARACPRRPVDTGLSGVGPLRFTLTVLRDSNLELDSIAVRVRAVGALTNGKHVDQTSYAVYQRVGDVISGVYSFGPNTAAQQRFALQAAEASARLLDKLAPKGPPA